MIAKLEGDRLAEARVLVARCRSAAEALGVIDYEIAQLEGRRAQARTNLHQETQAMRSMLERVVKDAGVDVPAGKVVAIDPATGEVTLK
jgi:hypothetical protein